MMKYVASGFVIGFLYFWPDSQISALRRVSFTISQNFEAVFRRIARGRGKANHDKTVLLCYHLGVAVLVIFR